MYSNHLASLWLPGRHEDTFNSKMSFQAQGNRDHGCKIQILTWMLLSPGLEDTQNTLFTWNERNTVQEYSNIYGCCQNNLTRSSFRLSEIPPKVAKLCGDFVQYVIMSNLHILLWWTASNPLGFLRVCCLCLHIAQLPSCISLQPLLR